MRRVWTILLVPVFFTLQCGGQATTEGSPRLSGTGGEGGISPDEPDSSEASSGGTVSSSLGETRSIEITVANDRVENIYLALSGGNGCSELSFWNDRGLDDQVYNYYSYLNIGYSDTLSAEFGVITCEDRTSCERVTLESDERDFVGPDLGIDGPALFLRTEQQRSLTYFLDGVGQTDIQTLKAAEGSLQIMVGGFLEGDPSVQCMLRGDCNCIDDICSVVEEHPSCWYESNCDSEYDWLYEDHQCGPALLLEIDQINWNTNPVTIRAH